MQVMYATKHSQGYVIVLRKIDFDYINIHEGGSLRLDCPLCLNRNTLSIKKIDGKVLWNCFHVSCDYKGVNSTGYSIKDIEYIFDTTRCCARNHRCNNILCFIVEIRKKRHKIGCG